MQEIGKGTGKTALGLASLGNPRLTERLLCRLLYMLCSRLEVLVMSDKNSLKCEKSINYALDYELSNR